MENEIKEILFWLYDEYPKETQKLIDYITNLQEENKKLKEDIEVFQNLIDKKWDGN